MTRPSPAQCEILADPEALARRAAEWLVAAARAKDGVFAVALSGGSTPRRLYELLAERPSREAFPWSRSHWFWGDERFVPPDDPQSNFHMAREAMLAHAPVPAANVHAVPTDGLGPTEAAAAYERALKSFYGAEQLDPSRPLFDVTLLGLGPDGHTASLFPGTNVLAERRLWVAAVLGAKTEARITLTYPALDSSRQVAFLVAGAEKHAILKRFLGGDAALPATHVQPLGSLHVFADVAAGADSQGRR